VPHGAQIAFGLGKKLFRCGCGESIGSKVRLAIPFPILFSAAFDLIRDEIIPGHATTSRGGRACIDRAVPAATPDAMLCAPGKPIYKE
jgi:hypothetical protein